MADLGVKGGWIMITKNIPVGGIYIRPLSLFYATVSESMVKGTVGPGMFGGIENMGILRQVVRGRRSKVGGNNTVIHSYRLYTLGLTENMPPDMLAVCKDLEKEGFEVEVWVRVLTDKGDCVIQPHEYNVVQDISKYMGEIDGEHCVLNLLGGKQSGKEFEERMYYLNSKGIPPGEALGMLLGDINRPDVCYLTWHDEYLKHFGFELEAA